jgi:WD40 repeat protein
MNNKDNDKLNTPEDELPEYRRRRELRLKTHRCHRSIVIGAVIAALIVLYAGVNWDQFSPSALASTISGFFAGVGSGSFPTSIPSGDFIAAVPIGNNFAVLTDTSVIFYSRAGGMLVSRQHGMRSPCIAAAGGKAAVYDRGGKTLKIETRFDEPYTVTTQQAIVSASVSKSGKFCVVTGSENYLGELNVYDSSCKRIFRWYSSKGHILSACLSPDGTRVAAIVISSKNGSYDSTIYVFNVTKTDPIAKAEYAGTLLYSLRYDDSSGIAAVGDTQSVFIGSDGKKLGSYAYGDRELICYTNENGATALAFKEYGATNGASVVSLSSRGAKLGTAQLKGTPLSMSACDSGLAVVTQDGVWHSNLSCASSAVIKLAGDKLEAMTFKKSVYIFSQETIYRYKFS